MQQRTTVKKEKSIHILKILNDAAQLATPDVVVADIYQDPTRQIQPLRLPIPSS